MRCLFKRQGATLVIASAILFGIMPLLTKIAYSYGCNAYTAVFGRFSFGAATTALAIRGRVTGPVSRHQVRKLLVLSIFYAITPVLLYSSYHYISTGLATTLHFTYPVAVMVLDLLLFHTRPDVRQLLCFCICIGGLLCLCRPGGGGGVEGLALAVLSGITYSIYILLLGKSGLKELPVMTITFWIALFSAGEVGAFAALAGKLTAPTEWQGWVALAGLGILTTTLALALFQAGVFLCGEVKASLLSTFEPLTSVVIGILIFHEAVTLPIILGTGLIILSVILLVCPSILVRFK